MRSHLVIASLVATGIIAIQILVGLAVYKLLPDWPTRGQFGDVFGVVNASFSGLAFAGLIYAILLQREDLALQRTELELTRQELRRSAAAQEQSEIALRAQAEATARSARMASTNFLLEHYKAALKSMHGVAYTANDPRLVTMRELERREGILLDVLNSAFLEISGEGEANVAVQDR